LYSNFPVGSLVGRRRTTEVEQLEKSERAGQGRATKNGFVRRQYKSPGIARAKERELWTAKGEKLVGK
jgi:hypothetical protein